MSEEELVKKFMWEYKVNETIAYGCLVLAGWDYHIAIKQLFFSSILLQVKMKEDQTANEVKQMKEIIEVKYLDQKLLKTFIKKI